MSILSLNENIALHTLTGLIFFLAFSCSADTAKINPVQPMLCVNLEQCMQPKIRYEDNKSQAIVMIPIDAIRPFLMSPKVLNKNELHSAPYIVAFAGEHLIAGTNTHIYVRSIFKKNFMHYTTYRVGKTYKDADTDEILGYEAIHIANNTVVTFGDPATLNITNALREVRLGDYLIPAEKTDLAFDFYPVAPSKKINASIIANLTDSQEMGQFDIVVIDKGAKNGLKFGHLLNIMDKSKKIKDPYNQTSHELVKLPSKKLGSLLIFRTFDRVSYGLIIHAIRNIHLLDKVRTPE
jgi:hypothetical protein